MRKAFVLLSGGIDSTTCLAMACKDFAGNVVGVSIDYGQRHKKEIEFARSTCFDLGLQHIVLTLDQIIPKTMLTDGAQALPNAAYSELKGVSPTYVPFRNGLMLSALASFVHGIYEKENVKGGGDPAVNDGIVHDREEWGIYFGAHAEDAANWAYPDCTPEFIGAMANAIYIGTYQAIRLHTPLQWLGKAAIIEAGDRLGVDWTKTWSCYNGGEKHCGTCPTCRARHQGFMDAGWSEDPTEYVSDPAKAA